MKADEEDGHVKQRSLGCPSRTYGKLTRKGCCGRRIDANSICEFRL